MHFLVSIPLDKALADFVGKGTTEGSMTIGSRKVENDIITGLFPNLIAEKFYTSAETMLLGDQIILSTQSVDQLFGEVLIGASLTGKKILFTKDNDISNLLGSLNIPSYEFAEKQNIISKILAFKKTPSQEVRVDIDHAFPVKGIGTVILGIVTSGKVKVHDQLYHSSGKLVEVKSIQSQDIDIQEADSGTRVGLGLKGIEHTEIEKGDILTKEKVEKRNSVSVKTKISEISKEKPQSGSRYLLVSNFLHSNVLVETFENDILKLRLEKSLILQKNDSVFLLRTTPPRIFASGIVL